jgi:hypothetical protein
MTRTIAGFVVWGMASLATAGDFTIASVAKIWDAAPHNAFTDLVRHDGRWLCVFREGAKHVSPDGKLRVIASKDGKAWESLALLESADGDLRDAKITVRPDGSLLLLGAVAYRDRKPHAHRSLAWTSKDGNHWSAAIPIGDPDVWLWRVSWNGTQAIGFGYPTVAGDRNLRLYRTGDGEKFDLLTKTITADGQPNESAIAFEPDGTARCLLRRETGSKSGRIGTAKAPYTTWTWKDLGVRIGGPQMIRTAEGRWLAVVRLHEPTVHTALVQIDPDAGQLTPVVKFPSGGDTSYAGMVWHDGKLHVSYYSTHETKTSIYFAVLAEK